MNRDVELRCRVTDDEKALIKSKSDELGMKMSEYVRLCCIGSEISIQIKTNVEEIK
jgi:hypothetical protein